MPTTGLIPWNAPTTAAITSVFSTLARHFSSTLAPLLLSRMARPMDLPLQEGVHVAGWTHCSAEAAALFLLVNPSRKRSEIVHIRLPLDPAAEPSSSFGVHDVFEPGRRVTLTSLDEGGFQLTGVIEPMGTGAWLVMRTAKLDILPPGQRNTPHPTDLLTTSLL